MHKKILTIAIPTFNGSKYINETLESIISQPVFSTNNIEILVSDNASTDNTNAIVDAFSKKHACKISYYLNEFNIGYDRNIDNCIRKAVGEFVWIMSDDDVLSENSMEYLLKIINQYPMCAVIFGNLEECDIELKKFPKRTRPDIENDKFCKNGNEFFIHTKLLFGLVSEYIFKKDDWLHADIHKYFDYAWIHVGSTIELLKDKPAFIISKKIVKHRIGNVRWGQQGSFIITLTKLLYTLRYMLHNNYDKNVYNYIVGEFYRGTLGSILSAKSQGLQNGFKIIKLLIPYYKKYTFFWLVQIPILMSPNIPFILFKKIKVWIKNILKILLKTYLKNNNLRKNKINL